MDSDCRVKMDVAGPTAPREGHKSALKTLAACDVRWRGAAALLAVALCVAGVLCGALHFKVCPRNTRLRLVSFSDLQVNLRQISKSVRAAIHLEGEYNNGLSASVHWKTDVDQYHSEGGLKLKDNEIVIPHQGLYFVYSQASFRVSCHVDQDDQSGESPMVHLSYTVQRWSDSYSSSREDYETILNSVRTACEKNSRGDAQAQGKWFNAVYMGAVFHLNAGDRLKTVMDKKLLPDVNGDPGQTFFGVFAL
ncbi:unnamed protein product [Lota lota]